MGYVNKYMENAKKMGKHQNKLIKIYAITAFVGLLGIYFLVKPIGPMREMGMWAGLTQMLFLTCFGFLVGTELSLHDSSGSET